MEKEAEKLFLNYKRKYIRHFGRKSIDNFQIEEFCQKEFKNWRGCYAQDEKFKIKNGCYIINTDVKAGKGEHWCGMYVCSKTAYVFDSFARDPKKLLSYLTKNLRGKQIKVVSSDRSDTEQRGLSEVCGPLCIAWLSVVRDIGIRKAVRI